MEAARAFGMSWWQMQKRVAIPAMVPFALPGLANLWLITTKDTALLAVVGFSELTLETKQAAGGTRAYFLFYSAAGLLYLCLTLVSNVIDKETQEKIDIIKSRMMKYFGYNEVSARDVLDYVASIYARGDVK